MKRLVLIFSALFLVATSLFGQKLNGYKYVSIPKLIYRDGSKDIYGISHELKIYFVNKGFIVLPEDFIDWPPDAQLDPCLILYFKNLFTEPPSQVGFTIENCKNEILFDERNSSDYYLRSMKKCLKSIDKLSYSFNPSNTPVKEYSQVEKTIETEESIKKYLTTNNLDPIEGIYKSYQGKFAHFYKFGIIKQGLVYKAIIIESLEKHWGSRFSKRDFRAKFYEGVIFS